MKSRMTCARLAALMVAALSIVGAPPALAVSLSTVVSAIYQVGTTANVHLGHVVIARTNFNQLFAGGSFTATCARPEMLPLTGQRFLSSSNIVGGLSLFVTIPAQQPAEPQMPGYFSLPRGTVANCTYNWISKAVEGGYSIGAGGISYQIGNGEMSEGSSQFFQMKVPSLGDENGPVACIP